MLLGVNTHEAVTSKMKSIATQLNILVMMKNFLIDGLTVENDSVVFLF